MSEPNFDHSEGDWEEYSSEPNWTESQWRNYLKGSDRDTARFLSFYNSVKDRPNHLDEVASLMGWDAEDISMTDDLRGLENEPEAENNSKTPDADGLDETDSPAGATGAGDNSGDPLDASGDGDGDAADGGAVDFPESAAYDGAPYTLHRHPVFVVTRSLYRYLNLSWEHFMDHSPYSLPPRLSWDYAKSLHHGETNAMLAIQALDLGDFGLAICHLKNALSALNTTFEILNHLSHPNQAFLDGFRHEARIRLFDLRELWIRVMGDCRHESQRRSGGEG
jgi:hypothetical protein